MNGLIGILANEMPEWQWTTILSLVIACVAVAILDLIVYLVKRRKRGDDATAELSEQPAETAEEVIAVEEQAPAETAEEVIAEEEQEPAETAEEVIAEEEQEPVGTAEEVIAVEEQEPVETAEEIVAEEGEEPVGTEEPESEETEKSVETVEEPAEEVAVSEAEEIEEEEEEDEDFGEDDETETVAEEQSAAIGIFGQKILFRYNFSFRAKLIQSPPEIQARYNRIMDELRAYPRVKTNESWKQVRIYSGRKTLGMLLFKGRKLCMTFALDPKEYEETKYRGKDVSEIKRFQNTPMLMKLISDRKVNYSVYLFAQIAAREGLVRGDVTRTQFFLPYETTQQLIEEKLVKVMTNEKAEAGDEFVHVDISTMIRDRITLKEAQEIMTDEVAETLIETEQAAEEERVSLVSVPKSKRCIINIDTLSQNFEAGETVTLDILKQKGLVPARAISLKVLARGFIDKPLTVEAHDFSLDAAKMIFLTGGKVKRIQ